MSRHTTNPLEHEDQPHQLDWQRFTATGRPQPSGRADPLSNLQLADGGSGFASSGTGNLLPHRFTDDSLIIIPIPVKDYDDGRPTATTGDAAAAASTTTTPAASANEASAKKDKKGSWLSRLAGKGNSAGGKSGVVSVRMTRRDYLAYWAKGDDGKYRADVVEPPGGRRAWVEGKLREQEGAEWRQDRRKLSIGGR